MLYWIIPLFIGLVLLTVFLVYRAKGERVKAVFVKGFVSLSFIFTALVAWKCSSNPNSAFGIYILIGLTFGLLGDIFLDLKFIILKHEHLYTVLGFASFFFGHLFYIIGLFTNFYDVSQNILYIIIPVVIATILAIVTLLFEPLKITKYGRMRPYVGLYAFMLFLVTPLYFSVAFQSGWKVVTVAIMAPAFISFALSDLILNNTYFGVGFDKPIHIVINHLLYYIAQFMIAISLFFLV